MRHCNDLTYLVRYDYETGLPWRDPGTEILCEDEGRGGRKGDWKGG